MGGRQCQSKGASVATVAKLGRRTVVAMMVLGHAPIAHPGGTPLTWELPPGGEAIDISLHPVGQESPLAGCADLTPGTYGSYFIPAEPLSPATEYEATVSWLDAAYGSTTMQFSWRFSTDAAPGLPGSAENTPVTTAFPVGGALSSAAARHAPQLDHPLARSAARGNAVADRAWLRLTCLGTTPCHGVVLLMAKLRKVLEIIGTSRFSVPPGQRALVAVRLNHRGRSLLDQAGGRSLIVRVGGRGIEGRALKLMPKTNRASRE
jgi:hypothetical protein